MILQVLGGWKIQPLLDSIYRYNTEWAITTRTHARRHARTHARTLSLCDKLQKACTCFNIYLNYLVILHGRSFSRTVMRRVIVNKTNTMRPHVAGVFLYLPTTKGAACPRRMYSMSRPDSHWTPLVHKYLRGLDLQRDKQDGVAFQDFQVCFDRFA